jgi:hypothetical protein
LANTNVLTTGGKPPYSTIGICQGSHQKVMEENASEAKGHRAVESEANVVGTWPFAFSSACCEATCVHNKKGGCDERRD